MNAKRYYTVCLIAAALCLHVKATTIYFDDFSGDGSSDLIGTTPDITTGGATWNNTAGSSSFLNDGTATARGTGAYLPISVESGKTYTLTLEDVAVNSQGSQWVSFGFTNLQANNHHNGNQGHAWALYRPGTYSQFAGSGASNLVSQIGGYTGTGSGAGPDWIADFRIVLDTTPANWTISYFARDETQTTWGAGDMAGFHEYTTNPTGISYVGIGNDAEAGDRNFGSFELAVIPEPSTLALFALTGVAAMLGLRRRRS